MTRHHVAITLVALATAMLGLTTILVLAPVCLPERIIHTTKFDYLSFYSSWGFVITEPALAIGALLLSDRHTRPRRFAAVLLSIWVLVVLGSLLIH